jgi:hypothetical protein
MMASQGFAFSPDDAVLATIGEYEEADDYLEADEMYEEEETSRKREAAASKTATLAAAAEKEILMLEELLGKLKTGTATRDEKDRLKSMNGKLSKLRKEVETSKHRESELEFKFLRSTTKRKAMELKKSIKEKEIRSVIRSVCAAESVDLAFIVDATSSMHPHIEEVKRSIKGIIQKIRRTNGNLNLRVSFVGYRDFCDGPKRFEVLDFVSSVGTFEAFVDGIAALGGGDAPEDMAGGIREANLLNWRNPTRVAFLIADAPCHGREFHCYKDSYPEGSPGIDIKNELKKLISNHDAQDGSMTVNFGRICSGTDTMIRRFEDAGIPLEVVSLSDVSKLTACVTTGVRKSIFKTMTVSGGTSKAFSFTPVDDVESLLRGGTGRSAAKTSVSLKEYSILPRRPSAVEWKRQTAVPVKVFKNKSIKKLEDLQAPIGIGILRFPRARTDKTMESTMFMRCASDPFAEGEIRIAFHGQLSRTPKDLDLEKNGMVMKSFKHIGKGLNDRQQYLKQMEVSNIAHFLANSYNKSSYRPSHCAEIRFLQVCVVEEEDESKEVHGNRRFCVEEPLPVGASSFVKYSNNTGFWNDEELDESLLRFTDYTFEVTNEYLVVTDLQGIREGNTFFLTDPVILCKDVLRFGHTNLGEKFMKKCCDATCALMSENGWMR